MAEVELNLVKQVKVKSGFISVFESKEKATGRAVRQLNKDGYEVMEVYPDGDFSKIEQLKVNALTVASLGMYGRRPGMVIVARKVK